jgi:hypothetical protein
MLNNYSARLTNGVNGKVYTHKSNMELSEHYILWQLMIIVEDARPPLINFFR